MGDLSFREHFEGVLDPRESGKVLYPLREVVLLTLCAVISGCESFVDVAEYGRSKLVFLRTLLPFHRGTPSHDVLSDLFRRLDAESFGCAFRDWAFALNRSRVLGGVVAVDGKTLRGSKRAGGDALHLISAWADGARMVLGQRACRAKKNEVADIPELLDLLAIKGALVTCDAMGCQKKIAAKIRDKGADYLLALKRNQPALHEDVKLFLEDPDALAELQVHETIDGDKGRIERRRHWVCDNVDWLAKRHPGWKDIALIGMVKSVRDDGNESTRFYISSRPMTDQNFAQAVRSHWTVENRLHWVMDVTFRDDDCRVRMDNGPQYFATIKHMALNLINKAKQNNAQKTSVRVLRKKAGWDNKTLKNILNA